MMSQDQQNTMLARHVAEPPRRQTMENAEQTAAYHCHCHRLPFFSSLHSLKIPSRLLYIRCDGKQRMISPTRASTSLLPFSSFTFFANSTARRKIAKTARETCVCWAPCAEPCERAERRGPDTLGVEMTGVDWE